MSFLDDDEDEMQGDDKGSIGKAAALNGALAAGMGGLGGSMSGLEGKNLLKYMAINGVLGGAGGGLGQALGGNLGGIAGGVGGQVLGQSELGVDLAEGAEKGLGNVMKYLAKLRGK